VKGAAGPHYGGTAWPTPDLGVTSAPDAELAGAMRGADLAAHEASPPLLAGSRIGYAEPPVRVAHGCHATRTAGSPARLVLFFARSVLDAGVPFAAMSLVRWAFRALRWATPRPLVRALVGAASRIGLSPGTLVRAWRERLLAAGRRTHGVVWLALLLFGGPLFRWAGRLGRSERPGRMRRSVLWRLAQVRERLRRDVLTIDRDVELPSIGPGLAGRAYRNWTTILELLDPPTWFVLDQGPRIGLVSRWTGDRPELVCELARDLAAQVYDRFELVVALDGVSALPDGIDVHGAHLVTASGAGGSLAAAWARASGDFVGVIDVADRLHPHMLLELAAAITADPAIDVVYADEDWVEAHGRCLPHLKPDHSPELQRATGYIGRPWLARRSAIEAAGGLRFEEHGTACEYDLLLRLEERGARFTHVPRVLYHWRLGDHRGPDSGRYARALSAHLARVHGGGDVEPGLAPGVLRARPHHGPDGLVSVIVPNRDQPDLLARCVASIHDRSTYPNLEVLIVENGSTDARVRELYATLEATGRARVIAVDQPTFNFSRLVNAGVAHARGDYVVLLNNDTEVRAAGWIEAMLEHARRADVGAVGARLLYPDGTLQHGGVVLGPGGLAGHVHRGIPESSSGYARRLAAVHEVSAVTAACMMVRRAIWREAGGMDETLAVAYNDVDFCLGLRARGYRIVQTPHAELVHHEHRSRGLPATPDAIDRDRREAAWVGRRWAHAIARDPYLPGDFTAAWLFCAGRENGAP